MDILLQRYSDANLWRPLIYHLRMLAIAQLRSRPTEYAPFIPTEEGIEGYCSSVLLPVDREIDHLGMSLLIDILLKPIGFVVEVVYLDRSAGSQANSHRFEPTDSNGQPMLQTGPTIYLLYRIGHYDILYKDASQASLHQAVQQAIPNSDIQVHRATNFSHNHIIQSTPASMDSFTNLDLTSLFSVPGFGVPQSQHGFTTQYSPMEQPYKQPYTASPVSASPLSSAHSPVANSSTSGLSLSTTFSPQQAPALLPISNTPHSSHSTHNHFSVTTQIPIHTQSVPQSQPIRPPLTSTPSLSPHPSDLATPISANSSFRPSKYEWEAAADWQEGPVVFQTSTFKNSHYNTAHYNNPNFHPEEWSPDCEEVAECGGVRKRSTGS